MAGRPTLVLAGVLSGLLLFALSARAATLSGASIQMRGDMVELRFKVQGAQPQWQLHGGHQALNIDLANTRVDIAERPLAGREIAPITDVQIASDGSNAQLIIGVKGKVDYAATLAAHQLIVRFARAGTAPDIGAPVVIRNIPHRSMARARSAHQYIAPAVASPSSENTSRIPPVEAAPRPPQQMARLEPPAPIRNGATPVVVIDPGHGGHDPGTSSASGIAEKDVALQIATRLQRSLRMLGINAELTRADDRFLSLAERTQLANHRGADLFVSIHLNSSPDTGTSGIETYYLNNTTDRATIRLARMENEGLGTAGDSGKPNLNYILTDLRQGDKANESVALARMIENESVAALATTPGIRVNALGAKQGPFYVLVGAEMPAVLVECGFLSNRGEAERLTDGAYQQGLADGIAAAIGGYFNNNVAVGNL